MRRLSKSSKKITTYHELVEATRKDVNAIEKEYKTIQTKDSGAKSHLKKLEKDFSNIYTNLLIPIQIDTANDELLMIDNLFVTWRIIIEILKQFNQTQIPEIIYQYIIIKF